MVLHNIDCLSVTCWLGFAIEYMLPAEACLFCFSFSILYCIPGILKSASHRIDALLKHCIKCGIEGTVSLQEPQLIPRRMEYQGPFKGRLGSSLDYGGPRGNAGSRKKLQTYWIGQSKAHATENFGYTSELECSYLCHFSFLQRGHPVEGDTELTANMTGLTNQLKIYFIEMNQKLHSRF